jgi:hypothetical protein
MIRRVIFAISAIIFVVMLFALWKQQNFHGNQGGQDYVDSLFDRNNPVLVTKGVFIKENALAAEKRIGTFETQVLWFGSEDVELKQDLDLELQKLPLMARLQVLVLLQAVGIEGELKPFRGRLSMYLNRSRGLASMAAKINYGDKLFSLKGHPVGGNRLEISGTLVGSQKSVSVPFDPKLPLSGGANIFRNMRGLKPGQSWNISYFNPMTRKIEKRRISVVREDSIIFDKQNVKCSVLNVHPVFAGATADGLEQNDYTGEDAQFGMPTAAAWVRQDDGNILREELYLMGMTIVFVLEQSINSDDLDTRKIFKGLKARSKAETASPETTK